MQSINDSQVQALPGLCTDLFSLLVYLRESQAFDSPDALYDRIASLFNTMDRKAREARIADVDIQDVKYALVAFIDETVGWESRLELKFFGSNVAGEEFFNKLEREKKAEARDEVLEVYYLCIMLGFEGKYVRAPEELQAYIKDFQKKLRVEGLEKLSPHGERPKETIRRRHRGIPSWVPLAYTGTCFVASVLIFILLDLRVPHSAAEVVDYLQRLLR